LPESDSIHSPNIVYMATLGKAAGVFGAFVAAQTDVIETLIQSARSYIYTTATPPLLSFALLASLKLIEQDGWLDVGVSICRAEAVYAVLETGSSHYYAGSLTCKTDTQENENERSNPGSGGAYPKAGARITR